MKYLFLAFTLLLSLLLITCEGGTESTTPQLAEGRWTGTLTPMNHPDMQNPIGYEVGYPGDSLRIQIVGPSLTAIPTYRPRLQGDTLYFAFDEPEEQVRLNCALAGTPSEGFAGRCVDATGKWARFMMRPPAAE